MCAFSKQKGYTEAFYDEALLSSVKSARQIVPLIMELLPVQSVVDFGCGTGSWLSVFKEHGVQKILGIDLPDAGDAVRQISNQEYLKHDLTTPVNLDFRPDLVMTLEVAEHLPPQCAESFVDTLTGLGDVILFSAAIPHQGGVNHVNEQWPEYWEQKFRARGFTVIDCLREKIWRNEEVAFWYAQNSLLFVRTEKLSQLPKLQELAAYTNANLLTRIHPKMYVKTRGSLASLKVVVMRAVWNRLPKFIRFRLVRYLGQRIWEQMNTSY